MVIGSKAAAAAADIPQAANTVLLQGLSSSAGWQHGNTTLSPGLPQETHVSLWPQRAEEAWLCTAVFGEQRGSWLCGLPNPAGDVETQGSGDNASQGGGMLAAKKKKKHHHHHPAGDGLGLRDVIGICLSLLGAASLAAFMLVVQVGGQAGRRGWASF